MAASIEIPPRLHQPNRFVTATRDAGKGITPGDDGRLTIGPKSGVFHLVVSRDQLRRALLLCQAICDEAERRIWTIREYAASPYRDRPGVAIGIGKHDYPVEVHELTETLDFSEEEITAWRAKPDWETRGRRVPPPQHKRRRAVGRLRLELPNGFHGGRATWTEGRRGSFEARLSEVFETLEQRVVDDDRRAIEAARAAETRRHDELLREQRARRQRIEESRIERLLAESDAWHRARTIRAYVATLRDRLEDLPDSEHAQLAVWCAWAEDFADRSDPAVHPELVIGFDDERDALGFRRPL